MGPVLPLEQRKLRPRRPSHRAKGRVLRGGESGQVCLPLSAHPPWPRSPKSTMWPPAAPCQVWRWSGDSGALKGGPGWSPCRAGCMAPVYLADGTTIAPSTATWLAAVTPTPCTPRLAQLPHLRPSHWSVQQIPICPQVSDQTPPLGGFLGYRDPAAGRTLTRTAGMSVAARRNGRGSASWHHPCSGLVGPGHAHVKKQGLAEGT